MQPSAGPPRRAPRARSGAVSGAPGGAGGTLPRLPPGRLRGRPDRPPGVETFTSEKRRLRRLRMARTRPAFSRRVTAATTVLRPAPPRRRCISVRLSSACHSLCVNCARAIVMPSTAQVARGSSMRPLRAHGMAFGPGEPDLLATSYQGSLDPDLIEVRWRPRYERFESAVLTDLSTTQLPRDGRADTFRRRLGLTVANMGVAQRHTWPFVTEQARDDRQRDALQYGVAGERMT